MTRPLNTRILHTTFTQRQGFNIKFLCKFATGEIISISTTKQSKYRDGFITGHTQPLNPQTLGNSTWYIQGRLAMRVIQHRTRPLIPISENEKLKLKDKIFIDSKWFIVEEKNNMDASAGYISYSVIEEVEDSKQKDLLKKADAI